MCSNKSFKDNNKSSALALWSFPMLKNLTFSILLYLRKECILALAPQHLKSVLPSIRTE